MYFFFVLLFSIYQVHSWNIQNTNCTKIIEDYIQNTIDPELNIEWNYPTLQNEIKKNVHCAVVYPYDN